MSKEQVAHKKTSLVTCRKLVNFIIRKILIEVPIQIISYLQIWKNSDAEHTVDEVVKNKPHTVLMRVSSGTASMEGDSVISIKITNAFFLQPSNPNIYLSTITFILQVHLNIYKIYVLKLLIAIQIVIKGRKQYIYGRLVK